MPVRGGQDPVDLLIRARRMVFRGAIVSGCVMIRDGTIKSIEPYDSGHAARDEVRLAEDEVLLPGLVDTHVHINEPGRTEWEGFASATRAAAAGGVTTLVDMPLNSIPPTVNIDALELKRKTAAGQCCVDVGFWGGAIPGNLTDLRPLHDAGVFGFKCFLAPSGVDEFPPLDLQQLTDSMHEIASFGGLLIVHAEDAGLLAAAAAALCAPATAAWPTSHEGHHTHYARFLASRPPQAEIRAIATVIKLAAETGCRVHILHLSCADSLPLISAARQDGVRVSAETCPHYLTFDAETIPDGATPFKCCPPIRERENRERLWKGLADGTIDLIASDHSPSPAGLKCLDTGDFGMAWGGISSLQLGLAAVWTEARARGHTLVDVVRWMSEAPARLVGMAAKGRIEPGYAADLCAIAPDDSFTVDARALHHRYPVTPYDGRALVGAISTTWLHGRPIDLTAEPRGRLLTRGAA